MNLLEALAHHTDTPMTVIKTSRCDFEIGRQFRWVNGTIQTRVNKNKHWHRTVNLRTWWLECLEVDDKEVLGKDPVIEEYLRS